MDPSSDDPFRRLDLKSWTPDQDEPSGENEKSWFRDPSQSDKRWIFKPNRSDRSEYEDRSELVASLLAEQLGVPAAHIRLAMHGEAEGCISKNVVADEKNQLEHASLFLTEYVEDFDPRDRRSRGHNVEWITDILKQIEPPILMVGSGLNALDCFGGYLLFDALIGNTDRHSENWAIEITPKGKMHLAPSYDHATSLGVTTRGTKLETLVADETKISTFLCKARAHRFEGGSKTSLVDFAAAFLATCSSRAITHWTDQLASLNLETAANIITDARMSASACSLAINTVQINRERLLRCLNY
ncbi:HipA domain-containing protein [Arthrobacter sp. S39]|uniref:HipA domain-containing protein n=1 Tax=Arthrobacter sp. S39 TaxID=2509720 RepID=UPI001037EEF8|nr:HipA domain-containing protein [Arthrobacter sp. S39]TAP39450.1 type II toxin-antitoxin system HipA family toxin [Arthrobacter sp. S39]